MVLKSCPSWASGSCTAADNLGIWIDHGSNWTREKITDLMEHNIDAIERAMREIDGEICRYHRKARKGKNYWYYVREGQWTYKGPCEGKRAKDPVGELRRRKHALRVKKDGLKADMRTAIIRVLPGGYTLVDLTKFKKYIKRPLPVNVIVLKTVLRGRNK